MATCMCTPPHLGQLRGGGAVHEAADDRTLASGVFLKDDAQRARQRGLNNLAGLPQHPVQARTESPLLLALHAWLASHSASYCLKTSARMTLSGACHFLHGRRYVSCVATCAAHLLKTKVRGCRAVTLPTGTRTRSPS
jgi:hypothetical protein